MVILDGGWGRDDAGNRAQRSDEALRLYYVAMTRARQTLTLLRMSAANELELRDAPAQHRGGDYWLRDTTALVHREYIDRSEPPPELDARYEPLELKDVDLGFAGQRGSKSPVHGAISALRTGDPLEVRENGGVWLLADTNGQVVGQLARNYRPPSDRCQARVRAIIGWDRRDGTPTQQERALRESWAVVVPELIHESRGDDLTG